MITRAAVAVWRLRVDGKTLQAGPRHPLIDGRRGFQLWGCCRTAYLIAANPGMRRVLDLDPPIFVRMWLWKMTRDSMRSLPETPITHMIGAGAARWMTLVQHNTPHRAVDKRQPVLPPSGTTQPTHLCRHPSCPTARPPHSSKSSTEISLTLDTQRAAPEVANFKYTLGTSEESFRTTLIMANQ